MPATSAFQIEIEGDTAILSPHGGLSDVAIEDLGRDLQETLESFNESSDVRNVVIDFVDVDYFGSSALGLLVGLGKKVRARRGQMVLCHVPPVDRETLRVTRLDALWGVYATRANALAAVRPGVRTARI